MNSEQKKKIESLVVAHISAGGVLYKISEKFALEAGVQQSDVERVLLCMLDKGSLIYDQEGVVQTTSKVPEVTLGATGEMRNVKQRRQAA
jgi:hypothetical protein